MVASLVLPWRMGGGDVREAKERLGTRLAVLGPHKPPKPVDVNVKYFGLKAGTKRKPKKDSSNARLPSAGREVPRTTVITAAAESEAHYVFETDHGTKVFTAGTDYQTVFERTTSMILLQDLKAQGMMYTVGDFSVIVYDVYGATYNLKGHVVEIGYAPAVSIDACLNVMQAFISVINEHDTGAMLIRVEDSDWIGARRPRQQQQGEVIRSVNHVN